MGGKLIISEPKTKAAFRTIILPPTMVELLLAYRKGIFSDLMFPSRIKPEQPIDPGYVRKRLQIILERAGCKRIRFHDASVIIGLSRQALVPQGVALI